MTYKPFGKELIFDCSGCDIFAITNKDVIKDFIKELCIIGDMKPKGETLFVDFEDNEFNRKNDIVGYTVVQVISLSNITLHFNNISRTAYMNFFTCGSIDEYKIYNLFVDYFKPIKINERLITRCAMA